MPIPGVKPSAIKAAEAKLAPKARNLPGIKFTQAQENRTRALMRPPSQQPERQTSTEKLATRLGTITPGGKPFKQISAESEQRQRERATKAGTSHGLLATITNLPAAAMLRGYRNLATATGIKPLEGVGKLAAEAVNLPTQVLPAAYHFGHAVGEKLQGHGQELHELGKEFAKESAIAHVVKGDFGGALKAAGEHPIGTGLEAYGVGSAVDRAFGAMGRMTGVQAAKLADKGATVVSRAPREYPTTAVPPAKEGGVTVAQRPYHKGLVRPMVEKKLNTRPISSGRIAPNLRKSFDRFEGGHLAVTRADRDRIIHEHHGRLKGVENQGAIVPFGQWLADPGVINPETNVPFAHEHLQEAIDHFSKPMAGEFPEEKAIREANVAHLKALQGKNLHGAYDAALGTAERKAALEPELSKHGYHTPETIRIAKLIPAFRFHFRGQDPFVEPSYAQGESPFKLGGAEGKQISVDQVAKQLEAKGVHEDQLSFVSTRPFQHGNAPFTSGRKPGGAKVAKGHLTGSAFMKGQFDPTADAALRQHLTDVGKINEGRGDLRFAGEYVHTRAQIANLLEKRVGRLGPREQATVRAYIDKLRQGSDRHFKTGQQALEAREHLRSLYPDIQLEPIKVAHRYATSQYRAALGKQLHDLAATHDMLDPSNWGPEHDAWRSMAPQDQAWLQDPTAGPVGLAHREIADRVRAYEKDLGSAHLSRMPASFWRKTNVAYSIRHIPGVTQELGIRALANNIGPLSLMRATRAHTYMMEHAAGSTNPLTKLGAQRWDSMRGTVAGHTLEATKRVPFTSGERRVAGVARPVSRQLAASKLGKPAEWWNQGEAHTITGASLRAVRGAMRAFNVSTNAILKAERAVIEGPPTYAGQGKHLAEEFKRMHGERMRLIGSMTDVEKAFLRGKLDPKAIDHAANMGREYFGEWTRSSPEFRNWQRASPFLQWYLNSLRFIYHTMPVHHPIKTGLLTAIEGATREQRLAEGQEYKGGFPFGSHLLPTDLEASQQGSLPFGNKERASQEYYTPQGAISAGPLETGLQAVLPYASGIWMVAHGIDPVTTRPLEEKNAEGKKEPITDHNKLALLAALSIGESFVPPLRYYQSLQRKPVGHVFRPLRTEKTRLEKPEKKEKVSELGGKIGGSIGGSIGGKLP